jgi:hypothetical protein
MSDAMVAGLAAIYAEGMRVHGWPAQLANRDGERGFGFHRMAVATACPCDVRLNLRQEILRRATGQGPAPTPKPPSAPSGGQEDSAVTILTSPGRLDMFVIGTDQRIWQAFAPDYNALMSAGWSPLGTETDIGKSVSASWSPDYSRLYVAVHGMDDKPYVSEWNGTAWGPFVGHPNAALYAGGS